MSLDMTRRSLSIAISGLLLVLAIWIFWSYEKNPPATPNPPPPSSSINELRRYWRAEIETKKAADVYFEFKKAYAKDPRNSSHLAAHIFGEILEQEMGRAGLVVCDSSFSFGCYHGFFIGLLRESPSAEMEKIASLCADFPPVGRIGCEHGIGHGLAEYYGSNILGALEMCKKVSTTTGLGYQHFGCPSGVFMEHLLPITQDDSVVEITAADAYEPCADDKLADFEHSCYVNLPGRWYFRGHLSTEAMVELCLKAPSKTGIGSCLLGIARGACLNQASEEAIASCFGDFFKTSNHYLDTPDGQRTVCGGLPAPWREQCIN